MTIDYDRRCLNEFAFLQARVERYFVELAIDCPYGLPQQACFYQAMFSGLTEWQMEIFLAAGYRRNGNCLYTMHCRRCRACVPIRLKVEDFRPNRNQRRVWRNNSDVVVELGSLQLDEEHLRLCDLFLQTRYPREQNRAQGYYGEFFANTIADTAQVQYRLDGQLIGAAVIDLGENFLNAVYFYFDPRLGGRSLGTFNILTLIDMCQKLGMTYLYLGYYIAEVSAMNYKARFQPCQLRSDHGWVDFAGYPQRGV